MILVETLAKPFLEHSETDYYSNQELCKSSFEKSEKVLKLGKSENAFGRE
jgi:hypothetical protein